MTVQEYTAYFDALLSATTHTAPYDNPDYLHYTELNHSRSKRWMKHGELLPETASILQAISQPLKWVIITEPWCGDAAHSVPFLIKLANANPLFDVEIQLRDTDSEIDQYLTNGGKSIPICVVRNTNGEDLFVWGPRPAPCQALFLEMKANNMPFEEQKVVLQKWYNEDKGQLIQQEICSLISEKL